MRRCTTLNALLRAIIVAGIMALLVGCASTPKRWSKHQPATHSESHHTKVTAGSHHHKDRYCIPHHGCYTVMATARGYHATGLASWYGLGATGKPTASGKPYEPNVMRVASKRLPFGTWLRIKNLMNGREVVAMVNDRGPYHRGRIIDGTLAVAKRLGYYKSGTAPISVKAIPPGQLSTAQKQVAKADQVHAVHYAKAHPHSIMAEAGKVSLHGVVDITTFGLKLGVGTAVGVLKVTGFVALHVIGAFF